jgi:hypothetical protein
MEKQENGHKRTFSEFFKRDTELRFRKLKITSKWIIFNTFYPFKSLFLYKRFKRVANGLQKQIEDNCKAGYWI